MSRIIEFRKSAQKAEKAIRQGKAVFTGHRPQSLPFGFDESDKRCTSLKSVMRDQISTHRERGRHILLPAWLLVSDMYAAEIVLDLKSKNTLTLLWKAQSLVRHKRSNGLWLHGNGIIISRQSVTRRPCCNGVQRRTAWTREIGTWSITPIIFSQYGNGCPSGTGKYREVCPQNEQDRHRHQSGFP